MTEVLVDPASPVLRVTLPQRSDAAAAEQLLLSAEAAAHLLDHAPFGVVLLWPESPAPSTSRLAGILSAMALRVGDARVCHVGRPAAHSPSEPTFSSLEDALQWLKEPGAAA